MNIVQNSYVMSFDDLCEDVLFEIAIKDRSAYHTLVLVNKSLSNYVLCRGLLKTVKNNFLDINEKIIDHLKTTRQIPNNQLLFAKLENDGSIILGSRTFVPVDEQYIYFDPTHFNITFINSDYSCSNTEQPIACGSFPNLFVDINVGRVYKWSNLAINNHYKYVRIASHFKINMDLDIFVVVYYKSPYSQLNINLLG